MRIAIILMVALCQIVSAQERINWYPTWQAGLQQARQSGKPILLVAAAPQCHGVSGVW